MPLDIKVYEVVILFSLDIDLIDNIKSYIHNNGNDGTYKPLNIIIKKHIKPHTHGY